MHFLKRTLERLTRTRSCTEVQEVVSEVQYLKKHCTILTVIQFLWTEKDDLLKIFSIAKHFKLHSSILSVWNFKVDCSQIVKHLCILRFNCLQFSLQMHFAISILILLIENLLNVITEKNISKYCIWNAFRLTEQLFSRLLSEFLLNRLMFQLLKSLQNWNVFRKAFVWFLKA